MFKKTYCKENLYSNHKALTERVKKINKFNPDISFYETSDRWIRYSNIKADTNKRVKRSEYTFEQLKKISKQLNNMYSLGICHGDIHPKNIIGNKDIKIVDFEIDLIQLLDKKWRLMVTHPYLALSDKNNFVVSSKTDFVCFLALFNNSAAKKLSSNEQELLLLMEMAEPFTEILNKWG